MVNVPRINSYIFLCVFIAIVLYIIGMTITIRISYKPLFDWWNLNNGKQYNDKLKIMNIVSAKKNAIIFYISNSILTPPLAKNTLNGIRFILDILLPNAIHVDPDTGAPYGSITPRSLCESVLPSYDDGIDRVFIEWANYGVADKFGSEYPNHPTRGGQKACRSVTIGLVYTQIQIGFKAGSIPSSQGWTDGDSVFVYELNLKASQNKKNLVGFWPTPSDQVGWAGLIFEWLNGPNSTTPGKWDAFKTHCPTDATKCSPSPFGISNGAPRWCTVQGTDFMKFAMNTIDPVGKDVDYYKYWFNADPKTMIPNPPGDNWISRMHVLLDSPLILGFINGTYTLGGVAADHQAFENLIGTTGGIAGGWMGFIHGNPVSSDAYTNLIHTEMEWKSNPSLPVCKPHTIANIFTGIAAGIGVAMMAVFAPESAPTWPFILAGAFSGGASLYSAQKSCT